MTASDQMRLMINQLMGTDRSTEDGRDSVLFSDPQVCRSFLLGCCPNEVLASTRMDNGDCTKIHDVALRADYERAQKETDHFYDLDAFDILDRFLFDCDRKMEIAKKKLAETQDELSDEATEKAEKVLIMNENIGKTLAEAEKLGSEGMVEESLALMEKLDILKREKQEADLDYRNSMPASSYQQQKLRVCEVCSAYLGIHDNDRRLADHFGGRLHVGFVFLREKLAELKMNVPERKISKEATRRDRDRKDSDSNERRRSRSPRDRRDRRHDRDRDRSSRHRDRDRDRDRAHRRSKDSQHKSESRSSRDREGYGRRSSPSHKVDRESKSSGEMSENGHRKDDSKFDI